MWIRLHLRVPKLSLPVALEARGAYHHGWHRSNGEHGCNGLASLAEPHFVRQDGALVCGEAGCEPRCALGLVWKERPAHHRADPVVPLGGDEPACEGVLHDGKLAAFDDGQPGWLSIAPWHLRLAQGGGAHLDAIPDAQHLVGQQPVDALAVRPEGDGVGAGVSRPDAHNPSAHQAVV